jgi:hypothetical protein
VKIKKNIAIIELGQGHQECIEPQVLFLKKAGYNVHLIISEKIQSHLSRESLKSRVYLHQIKGSKSIIELFKIKKYLKTNHIDKVVFNTAENAITRNMTFLLRGILCFGILHNISKLKTSWTQKLIGNKIKKYFVLNDYLKKNMEAKFTNKVQSFYPVFFPESLSAGKIEKPDNEIWITVPGQLEFKRRNYEALIDKQMEKLPLNIKFIFLGNANKGDGPEIISRIKYLKIESHFIFFYNYLSEIDYHSWIKNSDLIMPLLHPAENNQLNYLDKNISGSFNFGFAYNKPFLIHEIFSQIDDFKNFSLFYKKIDLFDKLLMAAVNKKEIEKLQGNYKSYEKFSFDFQYNSYMKIINQSGLDNRYSRKVPV